VKDSWQECSASPQKTVFVLCSNDGDYAEFLKELKRIGVDVFIWADEDKISKKLVSPLKMKISSLDKPML